MSVNADLESARRDWEEGYRRFREESRDPVRADRLHLELEAVTDELRKRLGSTFTLEELSTEYRQADAWARAVVAERALAARLAGDALDRRGRGVLHLLPRRARLRAVARCSSDPVEIGAPGRDAARSSSGRSSSRLLLLLAFVFGMAFARTLDEQSDEGGVVTNERTLTPLPQNPPARTVTVTVTSP